MISIGFSLPFDRMIHDLTPENPDHLNYSTRQTQQLRGLAAFGELEKRFAIDDLQRNRQSDE
ncbi:hypothetical protein ACFQ5Q_11920 [Luteolibacter ambystomatis]|uniref:hypothetical protein n=1 Tax=Luteolibacter ambystomatis TaxID=2824561 RepID=UPI003636B6F7